MCACYTFLLNVLCVKRRNGTHPTNFSIRRKASWNWRSAAACRESHKYRILVPFVVWEAVYLSVTFSMLFMTNSWRVTYCQRRGATTHMSRFLFPVEHRTKCVSHVLRQSFPKHRKITLQIFTNSSDDKFTSQLTESEYLNKCPADIDLWWISFGQGSIKHSPKWNRKDYDTTLNDCPKCS